MAWFKKVPRLFWFVFCIHIVAAAAEVAELKETSKNKILKGSIGVVSDLLKIFFFYITIKNLLDRLKTIIITLNFRTPAVSFIRA